MAALTRSGLIYSERRAPVQAEGFNPDVPVAGFYRAKLVKGGMLVGIRIWFGAPLDPVTGEELDRSHRWQALANDRYVELERVWPGCGGDPITEREYRFLAAQQDWGVQHAPDSAQADPTRRVDPLNSTILF